MTDKMTIEKAREILKIEFKHPSETSLCLCDDCLDVLISRFKAIGFIECYESREAEVENLKINLKIAINGLKTRHVHMTGGSRWI